MASGSTPANTDAAGCEGGALAGLEDDILIQSRLVYIGCKESEGDLWTN